MLANKPRMWVTGAMVLSLLLALGSWFLLLAPQRAEAAEIALQAADVQSQNTQIEVRTAQLKALFAELPARQAELAVIKQALPEDPALPTLVRELDKIADAAGVTVMTLTPGAPILVPSAVPAPVAAAPADGAVPAAPAAPSGDVLASIPTSMVVVGGFSEAELFLKKLQADTPRAFLVQTLTVQTEPKAAATGGKPATEHGHVTMTIAGNVFVLKSATSAAALVASMPADAITAPAAPPAGDVAN